MILSTTNSISLYFPYMWWKWHRQGMPFGFPNFDKDKEIWYQVTVFEEFLFDGKD